MNGGWTDGWGHKRDVAEEIRRMLRDPEVENWIDHMRQTKQGPPLRR